jgi:HTH-type transcriptional regulator / antitoxin HigA
MAAAVSAERLDEYLELVRTFPLEHIRNDAHLDAALAVFESLFTKPDPSPAEEAYLGALTDLIEIYEDATVHVPPRTGIDALRFLMEEHHLTQTDIAPLLGTQSVVSEVLSGKRTLTTAHIARLSDRFQVSPAVFFDDPPNGAER